MIYYQQHTYTILRSDSGLGDATRVLDPLYAVGKIVGAAGCRLCYPWRNPRRYGLESNEDEGVRLQLIFSAGLVLVYTTNRNISNSHLAKHSSPLYFEPWLMGEAFKIGNGLYLSMKRLLGSINRPCQWPALQN